MSDINDNDNANAYHNVGGEQSPVGYGKPPVQHRFKPGQSGNPKGRPRRQVSLDATMKEMLASKTSITINGKRRRVTVIEVFALRTKKELTTGPMRDLKGWLPAVERYAPPVPVADARDDVSLDDLTDEQLRVLASIKLGPKR